MKRQAKEFRMRAECCNEWTPDTAVAVFPIDRKTAEGIVRLAQIVHANALY